MRHPTSHQSDDARRKPARPAVTYRTPADELMDREDAAARHAADAEEAAREEWWTEATGAVTTSLDFLFSGGPHPAEVLWRFWALAVTMHRKEAGQCREVNAALLWEQSRAGVLYRLRRIVPGERPTVTEARISEVLRRAAARARRRFGWEPPRAGLRVAHLCNPDQWSEVWAEALDQLLNFFLAEGHGAEAVVRRIFAVTKWLRSDLVMHMSLDELGKIFGGEVRATQSWRIKKIVGGQMRQAGMHECTAGWQKAASTVEKFRESARGNHNRAKAAAARRPRSRVEGRESRVEGRESRGEGGGEAQRVN